MWIQIQQALNDSMTKVITKVANLLPGVVALVVALIIFFVLAWVIASILRRSLRSIQFDDRLVTWGLSSLAEWSPSNSPTLLVVRVVSWVIILIGFLVGLSAFDATLTSRFVERFFAYLPNVLAAVVLLFVGNIVARFLARSVLIGAVNLNLQYARLLSMGVKWLVLVLVVAMALEHLAIGGQIVFLAFGILFGGIVLALSLAVGLGSKDLVSRSLEREAGRNTTPEEVGDPFRHL
jgi:mechanosensitive ion channel-like protein